MKKQYYLWVSFICLLLTAKLGAQETGHLFQLDLADLTRLMRTATDFQNTESKTTVLQLPDHKGMPIQFSVIKSSVLSKEMEAEYPDFMTYSLQGIDDKLAYGRIFVSRFGIEGVVVIDGKRVKIEAADKLNPIMHRSYLLELNEYFSCDFDGIAKEIRKQNIDTRNPNGGTLRQYEIAIVGTGEFYQDPDLGNNNNTSAQAAVVNIINLVNLYWSAEMSVLLTIFSTPVVYTDPATDGMDPAAERTMEAAKAIHLNWPAGGYDLGHALHGTTNGGSGVAAGGVVCSTGVVNGNHRPCARGWSGGSNQNILGVAIMVHEIGHQFNAMHTFNGTGGSCVTGNHSLDFAFEIGSGTTIMSYEGNCQTDNNVSNDGDEYFHSKSLESIYNYIIASGSCSANSSTGNTPPVVDATVCTGPYTIPKMTAFELIGSGTDVDGDGLKYIWEQIDEDGAGVRPTHGFIGSNAGNSNLAPLFRSFYPRTYGYKRTFPSQALLLANNYTSSFEPLPNASRTLNFRLIARDVPVSSPYAAYAWDEIAVVVDATKGPLTVTAPNTAVTINAGTSATVTWDVNSTNSICNSVNILLSVDGGYTYPFILSGNTANDGTQSVVFLSGIPSTTEARVRIESACLSCVKFFDISNVNFTINSTCNTVVSNLCNTTPVTAESGSNTLNLSMNVAYGPPFTTKTLITSGSQVLTPFTTASTPGMGPCSSTNWGDYAAKVRFKPSASGNYTFNISTNGTYPQLTVYDGEYIPSQPCTNFLGSTVYNSGYVTNTMTLPLNACGLYTAVFFEQYGITGTLTITPPSGVMIYEDNPPTNPNYSYTYAAVNTSTNLIYAVSATASFSSLTTGSYCVYGMHYYSGTANPPGQVNPATFVGKSIQQLYNLGLCVRVSDNCKPVTVTGGCSALVTTSANSGPGSLRDRLSCNTEGTTITFVPAITQVNLTESLTIDKNMTLQGTSPTQRPNILTSSAGITIITGKTLTIQNVDIQHTGTQTINGGGTLSVTGLTIGKQ